MIDNSEWEEKVTVNFITAMKAWGLKEPKQSLSDYVCLLIGKAHDERNEQERKKILANKAARMGKGG